MLLGAIPALPCQHALLLRAQLTPSLAQGRRSRTSPGSQPSDMEQLWRGALLFPSRGWRGACFPLLPFRTQKGMYLGQPGRGRTCHGQRGGRGGDDSIFQVFGISELCLIQPLTACSRCWAIADVLANPGPRGGRCGWGGEYRYPFYTHACSMYHDHTIPSYSPFPTGHAPGWWWWAPRPRKRAMEQFKVAVSSWSFLSGDKPRGFKPVAVQDAPPSGPSPISTLSGTQV